MRVVVVFRVAAAVARSNVSKCVCARAYITPVGGGACTGRTEKDPTRSLFSTCQDDSACTVGARLDHYERAQEPRERKNCSIEVEVASERRAGSEGGEG